MPKMPAFQFKFSVSPAPRYSYHLWEQVDIFIFFLFDTLRYNSFCTVKAGCAVWYLSINAKWLSPPHHRTAPRHFHIVAGAQIP